MSLLQATRDQIDELKNRVHSLKAQGQDLENIEAQVHLLDATFQRVVNQLGTMEAIWTMVSSSTIYHAEFEY
jgi:hypothetical protein